MIGLFFRKRAQSFVLTSFLAQKSPIIRGSCARNGGTQHELVHKVTTNYRMPFFICVISAKEPYHFPPKSPSIDGFCADMTVNSMSMCIGCRSNNDEALLRKMVGLLCGR